MCTARLLTVSQHALRRGSLPGEGVCPGEVSARGGACPRGCVYPEDVCLGVSAQGGVCPGGCIPACNGADTPLWTDGTCENITFETSFAAVKWVHMGHLPYGKLPLYWMK